MSKKDRILLTSSDEFFDVDGSSMDGSGSCNQTNQSDLLSLNLQVVNKILKNHKVKEFEISELQDITITFDNDVKFMIFPDCLMKNYEYYRFIEFVPHWDDNIKNYKSIHHIVQNKLGKIHCYIIK